MIEKKFHEMTSQERFDRVPQKGGDLFRDGCGFCHDCGYYPSFTPRVLVANSVTGEAERYLLQLPPRCDVCHGKRGLTRYSYNHSEVREDHQLDRSLDRVPEGLSSLDLRLVMRRSSRR